MQGSASTLYSLNEERETSTDYVDHQNCLSQSHATETHLDQ